MMTLLALLSTTLGGAANAEYPPTTAYHASAFPQIAPHQQQVIHTGPNGQQIYPATHPLNQRPFNPGTQMVVMPYVPFDNEQPNNRTRQQAMPTQHSLMPRHIVYTPASIRQPSAQAKTWRQTRTAPNPGRLSQARHQVLLEARRQLGVRYRWGGNTPQQGFDCSGFTRHALRASNINIPRTAAEQSRASRTLSRTQLRPGDMIFFKTQGKRVNHTGIYLGNGHFIHAASTGGRILIDDLRKAYWQKRLYKYGTFLS